MGSGGRKQEVAGTPLEKTLRKCWGVGFWEAEEGRPEDRGQGRPAHCGVRRRGGRWPVFPPALSPAVCDLEQISSSLTLFSPPLGAGVD